MKDMSEDVTRFSESCHPHALTTESTDLLPIERVKPNKKYVCFEDAHQFARSLGLKTRKEWRQYVKAAIANKPAKPSHIPAHPDGIYKTKGWQGWKFWLGTAEQGLLQ